MVLFKTKFLYVVSEDNYDKMVEQAERLKPKLKNKGSQADLQKLIDGVRKGKQTRADNNLKEMGNIVDMAVPTIEKLIPKLPDDEIKKTYTEALNMLKTVKKKFDEGKGTFSDVEHFNTFLTNGFKKYLAKKS